MTHENQVMTDYYQDKIDALIKQYGDGVRPAWVGEDIGYYQMRIDELKVRVKNA